MRMLATIAVGAAAAFSGVSDAVAQNSGPVIVIPTRRDVPVVLYGRDVSYVVVEGDWGLSRPGHMAPSIVGYAPPVGNRASPIRGVNYPRYGVAPPRGRYEVEPPPDRQLPEPAESYSRSWGTQSPNVVAPRPAYQRPLDPIYPTSPNDAPLGPQSQNVVPPLVQSSPDTDVAPATVVDPQTFMMPPVVVDQRRRRP
ncbi:MAG: hypothetical protein AB1490_18570 [Pseudomonadota bacterium]